MAVSPQEPGQADFSLPVIAAGVQVNLLVFDRSPQSFNKDVVVAALPPSARKVDASPFRSPRGLDGAEQCVATARPSRLM
jgi:hypothetical protein